MKKQLLYTFLLLFIGTYLANAKSASSLAIHSIFTTPPPNDECANAISVTVNPTLEAVFSVSGTMTGATASPFAIQQNCSNDAQNGNDIWYSFIATSTKHLLNFNSIIGEQSHLLYYMVIATDDCVNMDVKKCNYHFNSPTDPIEDLIIGNEYKIRVLLTGENFTGVSTFNLSVTTPYISTNDECSVAIPITVNPNLEMQYFVSGTTEGATHSIHPEICSYTNSRDVWFSFIATSNNQLIHFFNITNNLNYNSLHYQVFSGNNCTNLESIVCYGGNSQVVNNLIIGDTYKINVFSSEEFNEMTFDLALFNVNSVINDECSNAINVPVNVGTQSELFTLNYDLGSTVSQGILGCETYSDTWLTFIASNTIQIVRFYDLNDAQIIKPFSLYSGETCDNLNLITCDSNGVLKNLVIGASYKIRINKNTLNSPLNEAFKIIINTIGTLQNDECANAINLTVNPDLQKTYFVSTSTILATPSVATQSTNQDIWFTFTATSSQHLIYIDNSIGSFDINAFPANNCEISDTVIYYNQNGAHLTDLTIGTTYNLRIYSSVTPWSTSAVFDLSILTPETVVNDECATAINIPVNPTTECEVFATGITQGATPSLFDNSTNGKDSYFSFVATSKVHIINLYDLDGVFYSSSNAAYTVFTTDDCDNPIFIGYGNLLGSYHNNLVIGTTYKIRLETYNTIASLPGTVKFCITTPLQPTNDDCSNAVELPINIPGDYESSTSATTYGANSSLLVNTCQGTADDDVWFSFVATSKYHFVRLTNIVPLNISLKMSVYQGSDCETMIFKQCGFLLHIGLNTLTVGETYKIRVYSESAIPSVFSNFNILVGTMTLAANDECVNSIMIPTSTPSNRNYYSGTLKGASQSSQNNSCVQNADDDVWYDFVAISSSHSIILKNENINSPTYFQFAVYSGDCTNLIPLSCSLASIGVVDNLIIGQTYKIRIWSTSTSPVDIPVKILVITTGSPLIADTTQFTNEELVTEILVNSPCVNVSNITSSTGTNFGSVNGIGYFTSINPNFPINSGIVLSTGNAANVGGPNSSVLSDGSVLGWISASDADLEAIILAATGTPMISRNTTKLEFDFTSQNEFMSFNFLFASEEYGVYQCAFADAFAFLLTDLVTGQTTNLAVVPGTSTPVSIVTIRNNLYNGSCISQNPDFYDAYFGTNYNLSIPSISPTNFNGQTKLMSASSAIIANNPYHIKMVIADRSDGVYDSAVFIQAGSFSSGPPQCLDKIELVSFIDTNNNGIKEDTESIFTNGSFVYQLNDIGDNIAISSSTGMHSIYDTNPLNSYDFSYAIQPEFAAYFSVGTTNFSNITIPVGSGAQTFYFPVTEVQSFSDVTVSIIPIGQPVAGSTYSNKIVYQNLGNIPASGTIIYTKDASVNVSSSENGLIITPTGFTYDFANLAPFETRSFFIQLDVAGSSQSNTTSATSSDNNTVLSSSITISGASNDMNLNNNSFEIAQIVGTSVSSNDKTESHGEILNINTFTQDEYLFYTIRFQNMKTTNAINIRVEDVLDAQLDETSVRMVSASHNYKLEQVGNQLIWNLDYIYLSSQFANDESSRGYITFKVKVKPGFEVDDVIPNTAQIYFDGDASVSTNTFESRFEVDLNTKSFISNNILLYPNPTNSILNVSLQGTNENLETIVIYDIIGKAIKNISGNKAQQATINVSDLASGVYMIEIITETNLKQIRKFIVN